MAVTQTNIKRESVGSLWSLTGDFTTDSGDSSMTVNHNFYFVASADVSTAKGGIGSQTPKITNSSGTMTVTWDDTQGFDGQYQIIGK